MTTAPDHREWLDYPDVVLLRTIATAVVRLADITGLQSFTLPYHPEAQRALDRTVLLCLASGARPPTGLPDLLEWCRTRPLDSWPLELPPDAFGEEDFLVDAHAGVPTQLCHEWAVHGGGDSAARQFDRVVVRTAMWQCREKAAAESYTAFRRLLVERPVLTENAFHDVSTDLYLDPVLDLIRTIYTDVPDTYLGDDGTYTPCGRCLTLLTPLADGGWWCERDQCRHQGDPPLGPPLAAADGVRQLAGPLRRFVTGPGRAEVALEKKLRSLGLKVDMWPGFDAYDLRVTFPDGYVWAIDVKDWAHPALLGEAARTVPRTPAYDEACWVVPDFRVSVRPDYLRRFHDARTARAEGLRLLTTTQLLRSARIRLRGGTGPEARIAPHPTHAPGSPRTTAGPGSAAETIEHHCDEGELHA